MDLKLGISVLLVLVGVGHKSSERALFSLRELFKILSQILSTLRQIFRHQKATRTCAPEDSSPMDVAEEKN